jgi:bacterioferritin-associated ferredoxin
MYICLCNPVTDRQIRGCIQQGARTLSDLQMELGIAAQCGMCAATALAIVQEETGASVCDPNAMGACPAGRAALLRVDRDLA